MSSETASQQLTKLLDELDNDSLAAMSDEEVLNLRKQLNPYGRTIEGSNKILTYSYTDLQFEYTKKLITTTMIGYLNRMCDEWRVPDGIPIIPVYDYVKDPSKLDEFENTLQDASFMRKKLDENKATMQKRVIIKEFLEDMFQYNPDLHVRSAYKPNIKDDERNVLDTPAAQLAIYELKRKDPDFKEAMILYEREKLIREKKDVADVSDTTNDSTTNDTSHEKIVSKIVKCVTEMLPPTDIFHRFQYYYDSNYEELRDIVSDLYCDKPCFETAINPYDWHDNEEDAEKFISKHRDEVISTIFKAHSGKWNIFSPYKKVRESMKYFNKKTAVLEEIAKQIESDAKMGSELMRKRIKIKKKKNIDEEGPDDEAFIKWKSQNSKLKEMGAESIKPSEYENQDEIDDALEVPVFRISNGGTKMEKTMFYTESVAPDLPDANELAKNNSKKLTT
jgi:hypothetical protein